MAANEGSLSSEKKELHVPALQELAGVLQEGLSSNFKHASVSVVDCPDLSKEPFTLAAPGICGKPRLADVGGPPFLIPMPQLNKVYDVNDIAKLVDMPCSYVLGAGAASHRHVGCNAEWMPNIKLDSDQTKATNLSHSSKVDPESGSYLLERYTSQECCLLANLFFSEGKPGKVLQVKASTRIGDENFVSCMRKTLAAKYGDKPIGMGGAFLIEEGKAKIHVMPDFSKTPLKSNEDVDNWLKFYEMEAPLICLSTFVSHDPGLDLRIEHSHCFSHHGDGGHYHYDVTPDNVSYTGYYLPAETLYRIDRPQTTHLIGRDEND